MTSRALLLLLFTLALSRTCLVDARRKVKPQSLLPIAEQQRLLLLSLRITRFACRFSGAKGSHHQGAREPSGLVWEDDGSLFQSNPKPLPESIVDSEDEGPWPSQEGTFLSFGSATFAFHFADGTPVPKNFDGADDWNSAPSSTTNSKKSRRWRMPAPQCRVFVRTVADLLSNLFVQELIDQHSQSWKAISGVRSIAVTKAWLDFLHPDEFRQQMHAHVNGTTLADKYEEIYNDLILNQEDELAIL